METRVYRIYPEQAADWVREHDIPQPPTEYDTITDSPGGRGPVAILSPEPFAFVNGQVEIVGNARLENFAHYRLAYFQGLTPNNIQTITEETSEERNEETLGVWDVSNLNGLYTLLLTVVREDGSFEEVSVPVTVDDTPPSAEIVFPIPNQSIFTDEEWVIVQAVVEDDISIDRAEFYIDNAGVPFAISTVPPFTEKWTISGPGCHHFHVVAVDAAGNETESDPVRVCLVARNN